MRGGIKRIALSIAAGLAPIGLLGVLVLAALLGSRGNPAEIGAFLFVVICVPVGVSTYRNLGR